MARSAGGINRRQRIRLRHPVSVKHTGLDPGPNFHAHHVFPLKFEIRFKRIFKDRDFTIHDPRFLAWWDKDTHLKFKDAYNKMWRRFFRSTPEPTPEQTVEQAIRIMKTFE